ncbi:MAG TPA: hypothetical protein PK024_09045 [Methanospirillum sp.]|uniref:hypothetical protein n=1 Tax=Methanospirillum sp. TaxID=45200 RepID=UPI002BB51D58|nr:hypothetical protein [Methanospirillum sp.]HOJ96963.1 hypothetical protein [Methanospirillum sp.]HPP78254.1 hypothetical protein [Methanospirillum sp.]
MIFTVVSSQDKQCVNVYPDIIVDDSNPDSLDIIDSVYQKLWDDFENGLLENTEPDAIYELFIQRLHEINAPVIVNNPQREIINLPA